MDRDRTLEILMTGLADKWPLRHLSINIILVIPPYLTIYDMAIEVRIYNSNS